LPLVSQTSEGVQYHQHDHLGTTVASYSTDGAIISAYETTVFGQGELEDSRTARFTGKPYDADLGAYVFPFRNYDPESARWLSADPSGFPDGPNQHYYAAVPTMGVDPLGLWAAVVNATVGYPDNEDLKLPTGHTSMNVSLSGNYSITLNRENGDIGATTFYFQVQIGQGGVIVDLPVSITVAANENSESSTGFILGTKSFGVGDYTFGVRVLQNLGGNNMPELGRDTGTFTVEK